MAAAARAIGRLRAASVGARLPGSHLNLVVADQAILPGESVEATATHLVEELGADSTTS